LPGEHPHPNAHSDPQETLKRMDTPLVGKRPTFNRDKKRSNSYRVLLMLLLIMGGVWTISYTQRSGFRPLLAPTPTPTRIADSYILQAEGYFNAGKIDDPVTKNDAINAYRQALELDPNNAQGWANLARILTYSSSQLSTQDARRSRLQEARQAIDKAVALAPDDSSVHGIRAFVLDWNASYATGDQQTSLMSQAENEAVRALQLDPNNGLVLAFYAEIQLDQQKWNEAEVYAQQAVEKAPNSMDAHRVYATVLESIGEYRSAIEEYIKASNITPNLTFLYINIGVNYRELGSRSNATSQFNLALEYFDKAVKINQQLGVKDPTPYIAIAKTYSQMGEFFAAALNGEKALSLDPTDANTYGQLGIIYFKSRNYESSLPALQCAVVGCSADENSVVKLLADRNPTWGVTPVAVTPIPLESLETAYYYAEYGQVLAYLSRPNHNYCSQAYPVLNKVRAYTNDEVLNKIANGSEQICLTLEGKTSP
jgi:tetratricopeptide (TPR) repeat protein